MLEFGEDSFLIDHFSVGLSGKEYDLSPEGLSGITESGLIDILSNGNYDPIENLENMPRHDLLEYLNSQLLKFHKPKHFDIFGIKDPRHVDLSAEEEELYCEEGFPKSVITSLPHATYAIPSEVRSAVKDEIRAILVKGSMPSDIRPSNFNGEKVKEEVNKRYGQFLRILKHFSDHGTHNLLKGGFIPESQSAVSKSSRSVTDFGRQPGEPLMTKDFYGNLIYHESLQLGKEDAQLDYEEFHSYLEVLINKTRESEGGVTLFDTHDTGDVDMGREAGQDRFDDGGFPIMNLGVKEGASCNIEIVEYYAERVYKHLGIVATIDKPYKGGYITTHYGMEKRAEMKDKEGEDHRTVNVIQEEVGKFLYMDETTQKIDHDKTKLLGIGLSRAKADVGRKFGKEYYSAMKQGDEQLNNYLENYQEAA